jgi:acetylglutamate kinase
MEDFINKAKILLETLPYIKEFYNQIMVIKIGGEPMISEVIKKNIGLDLVLMRYVGIKPVVVHGGGKQITELMHKLNKKSIFIDGLRVTDKETMNITEMVLTGMINKELVGIINQEGGNAVGISGRDANLIVAEKLKSKNKTDYGYVGKIVKVNPEIIFSLIDNNFIPVISPVGTSIKGEAYNINADTAASAIAGALKAAKLLILTDVRGIYREVNNENSFIPTIKREEIKKLIDKKIITGGMLPKVEACIKALEKGVKKTHIIDGRIPHSLILEIFTEAGVGTEIV